MSVDLPERAIPFKNGMICHLSRSFSSKQRRPPMIYIHLHTSGSNSCEWRTLSKFGVGISNQSLHILL